VEASDYDRLSGQLLAVLANVEDRLSQRDATLIHELIDAGEFGLALEQIADLLAETKAPVTGGERTDMLALVAAMQMDPRVSDTLDRCPHGYGGEV
jgi:hypothetical protein